MHFILKMYVKSKKKLVINLMLVGNALLQYLFNFNELKWKL